MIDNIERARVERKFDTMMSSYEDELGSESSGGFMAGVLFGARLHKSAPEASDVVIAKIERAIGEETESPAEKMEVFVRELADHVSGN